MYSYTYEWICEKKPHFALYLCMSVYQLAFLQVYIFFSYKSELDVAGELLILMMEQSSKEVMGTTCIRIF